MLKKIGLFSIFLLNTSLLLSAPTKTVVTKEERKARLAEKRAAKAQKSKAVKTAVVTVEPAVIAVTQAVQSVTTEPQTPLIIQPAAPETTSTPTPTPTAAQENQEEKTLLNNLNTHISNYQGRRITGEFAHSNSLKEYVKYDFVLAHNDLTELKDRALERKYSILPVNNNYYMIIINKAIINTAEVIIEYIKSL